LDTEIIQVVGMLSSITEAALAGACSGIPTGRRYCEDRRRPDLGRYRQGRYNYRVADVAVAREIAMVERQFAEQP
jgi:hypothetical protein